MASSTATVGSFEIGRVLSRAFDVITGNAATFLTLAVVASLPTIAFRYWSMSQSTQMFTVFQPGGSGSLTGFFGMAVLGAFIYYIFANLLAAALTHGTIVSLNGRKATPGECLATGLRHAIPLAIITFLATLGMMLGFILLIVPGFILLTMWTVLTPVRVAEQTSIMDTFSRSAELSSGFRWSIFGLLVIYILIAWAIGLAVGLVAGVTMIGAGGLGAGGFGQVSILYVLISGIGTIFTSLFGSTMIASTYYELRTAKEGVGPEQLASVFE
ncbi:MAG: hypothetical protein JOZ72_17325 [Alphaproteobacteria bacterium]|nr:hypothetical protein [Alphaproteobacteria bacterium]